MRVKGTHINRDHPGDEIRTCNRSSCAGEFTTLGAFTAFSPMSLSRFLELGHMEFKVAPVPTNLNCRGRGQLNTERSEQNIRSKSRTSSSRDFFFGTLIYLI
jgi:hypothetical protein